MQEVAGNEGVWRLEPHEKMLGVRLYAYDGCVPPLPDGTRPLGRFGVVGGRALRPKPASGGMYVVETVGETPTDQAMRIIGSIDVYGRAFACAEPQVAPPARLPDVEIARFSEPMPKGESAGYVYVRDGETGDARVVASYREKRDRYHMFDTWYDFGAHAQDMTYKELMTRAYLAFYHRPKLGAPAVPSRDVTKLLDNVGPEKPFADLRAFVSDVRTVLADSQLKAPGVIELLVRNLEASGLERLRDQGVPDDSVRLVRSTRYAHTAYFVANNDAGAPSTSTLWAIESALNRYLLACEKLGERASEAALSECERVDEALFATVGAQELAGGGLSGVPEGHAGGEWGLRCRLSQSIEQLRLPARVDVELRVDAASGAVTFGLTVPPAKLMPASLDEQASEQVFSYGAHVGLLLAAHAFSAEQAVQTVKLVAWPLEGGAADGNQDAERAALFEVDLTRRAFKETSGFSDALANDARLLFEREGARWDVAGAELPDPRLMHPAFEAWNERSAGDAPLPAFAREPLGAQRERDMDIEYDTAYRRVAENLADQLVRTSNTSEAIAAVRSVQARALDAKDERAASACTRLMSALAEGSLDAADQNAVVTCFLGDDRCLAALNRAHTLAETDQAAAVSVLTDVISEAQLFDGFVDGSSEVHRAFDGYGSRVLYNLARAGTAAFVPGVQADADKRVRVVPDSFYLCHLEVVHLLERSFERADDAIRYGAAAVAMAPTCAMGYRVLGRAYMLQGDMEHAFETLTRGLLVAMQPADISLMYYQLGYVAWKLGRAQAGVACYLKAVEASPAIALQATAELKELVDETGVSIPSHDRAEQDLQDAGILCAPSPEVLDALDAALAAACDAGLAHVTRSLLATRLRYRPDDVLMGVLRSFGEPA